MLIRKIPWLATPGLSNIKKQLLSDCPLFSFLFFFFKKKKKTVAQK